MNLQRKLGIIIVLAAVGVATMQSETLILFGATTLKWSWVNSYLFPKGLILVFALILTFLFWPLLQKMKKLSFIGVLLIFGICIGAYLLVNKPYAVDWNTHGTDMTSEMRGNPIEEFLNLTQPEFDGVICLALPDCEYCEAAVSRLSLVQERAPELDIIVFVFTTDSLEVEALKDYTKVTNLKLLRVPNPMKSIALCKGRFPSFLYYKNSRIEHRWLSGQFGYPALDWAEARLK